MSLQDIGMLAVSSNRTKYYIFQMVKHGLAPSFVLYMNAPSKANAESKAVAHMKESNITVKSFIEEFDLNVSLADLLKQYNIPHKCLPSLDPNSELVVSEIEKCTQSIFVYSGPGGCILKNPIFETNKRFLHIHSGILPYYRGSTTPYYSLLNDNCCGSTAFFMDGTIDTGPVIKSKTFPAPIDRTSIDLSYDPFIRSQLLIEVLQEYVKNNQVPIESQDTVAGETYFIIHPVLKHIAILSRNAKETLAPGK